MKKFTALAILPVIFLTSCSETEQKVSTDKTVSNSPNIETKENNSLDNNISTQITDSSGMVKKEFNLSYNLPDWRPLSFNWNLEIQNWVITAINFPEYNLTYGQWYEVEFAKKLQKDLIWKQIKGLQYDWMTWASLTTKAFSDYLSTINK